MYPKTNWTLMVGLEPTREPRGDPGVVCDSVFTNFTTSVRDRSYLPHEI